MLPRLSIAATHPVCCGGTRPGGVNDTTSRYALARTSRPASAAGVPGRHAAGLQLHAAVLRPRLAAARR